MQTTVQKILVILKKGTHILVSPNTYNLAKVVYLNDIIDLPYIEITNLLSLYSDASIMNYFIKNNLEMNFVSKSDSYSAALAMIEMGLGYLYS